MKHPSAPPRRALVCLLVLALTPAPLCAQDDEGDPFGTLFGERQDEGEEALPEDPFEQAEVLLTRGRHNEGETILRGLFDEDPEDEPVLVALIRLYLETGRPDEAAELLEDLRLLQPDKPAGHLFAAILAERQGKLKEAHEHYAHARGAAGKRRGLLTIEALVRHGELLAELDEDAANKTFDEVLAYYNRQQRLSAPEFTWISRACRRIDMLPVVKKQYRRDMSEYAQRMLDQAFERDAELVQAHVEAGRLALLKLDAPRGRKAFETAVELNPNHAAARTGLAEALLASFYAGEAKFGDAASNLQKALTADPTHAPAHALLGRIAVTDGNYDAALERVETGLRERPGDVGLLAVRAAVALLRADSAGFAAIEKQVLEARPRCARFYEAVASLVQLKFRYAEARDLARKALQVDPGYHPVLAILGVNLTRTGEEKEGRRVLEQANQEDPYNVYVYNHLELWRRLDKDYEVIESEGFTVRLHEDEKKVATRYVVGLLQEARQRLGEKYGAFPERVLVELFPKHSDFSARSVGLPGIPALGVCFGNVVTVLSSQEKKAVGAHSWGRTTWHELTHVATLTRTHNRVPRWLTEGLSVYEEPRGRPTWLREYDAEIMTLMDRGMLLPIARLDEGFTKPKYGGQVMMSYYQAGMICEFVAARWSFAKILELLDAYGEGLDTTAAVERVFQIAPEAFDARFLEFLRERYADFAWRPPPSLEQRAELLRRANQRPWDVGTRGALAWAYALHGKDTDAEAHAGLALSRAKTACATWGLASAGDEGLGFPGALALAAARALGLRAGTGDAYLALGLVAQRRGRLSLALRHLDRALRLGTRDPVLAHRVRGLIFRAWKRWDAAIAEFETVRRLSPPSADLHRFLAACWKGAGDEARAMAELKQVCALDSNDAKTRVTYANWAREQGRWADVAQVLDDLNMIDPFLAEGHLLLGEGLRRTALGARPKLERAIVEYQAALELDLDYAAAAYYGQAASQHELGAEAQVVRELLDKALADDPDHAEARALRKQLGER